MHKRLFVFFCIITFISAFSLFGGDITPTGMYQKDLHTYLSNVKSLVNDLRTAQLNKPLENPSFTIESNFDIKNSSRVVFLKGGSYKLLAAAQSFDTGTSKHIVSGGWSSLVLSVNADGTTKLDWSSGQFSTEAEAVADLGNITASGDVVLGAVTVQAKAAAPFTAGSDALEGGTGGDVAQDTHYIDFFNVNLEDIVAAALSLTNL